MSGHIIEIPQTKGKASIWEQRLKVAAYCRISTDHEDQEQSLENQVAFYTNYVRRNPYWKLSLSIQIVLLASTQKTGQDISSY